MVALALGMMVIAAFLSSLIFMIGSAVSVQNYTDMNMDQRRMLELIGRDLRNAVDVIEGFSPTDFQLHVLQVDGSLQLVTYAYLEDEKGRSLVRSTPDETLTLAQDVEELEFRYYNIQGVEVEEFPLSVKQIRIQMTASKSGNRLETARLVSARFLLRNKPVTN